MVTCVRCGKSLPIERADIVGTGHRCELCTVEAQAAGDEDVADNVPPEQREILAKQGKRRFFATMGIGGAAVGIPAAIALAVSGPLAALVAGGLGLYFGASSIGAGVDISLSQWRRYKQPPLPKAKLRK